jgi:hypothetical protein
MRTGERRVGVDRRSRAGLTRCVGRPKLERKLKQWITAAQLALLHFRNHPPVEETVLFDSMPRTTGIVRSSPSSSDTHALLHASIRQSW